jgi:hypothetical protein
MGRCMEREIKSQNTSPRFIETLTYLNLFTVDDRTAGRGYICGPNLKGAVPSYLHIPIYLPYPQSIAYNALTNATGPS